MVQALMDILATPSNVLWTTVVSAAVSAVVTYALGRRELRHRLETEYEYQQRAKLRELIGRYHGRLLAAAQTMSHRIWNLYTNEGKGWLKANGQYTPDGYYINTCGHRLMMVCSLLRQFEKEALVIDARIARPEDFLFVKHLNALRWSLTDADLVAGLPYNPTYQTDSFFSDNLRQYADACVDAKGEFCSLGEFVRRVVAGDELLLPIMTFFDSLSRSEDRLRWDRLVVFHLLLIAFMNSFGYPEQRVTQAQVLAVAKQVRHPVVLRNLAQSMSRHGLANEPTMSKVIDDGVVGSLT